MLKIGVFGAGHLGKIHIEQWLTIASVTLIGFYDPDDANAQYIIERYQLKRFETPSALIDAVDAVDIVTPTLYHFEIAKESICKSKHVFIEKPMTHTLEEAKMLVSLVNEANVKCQIGHVERFNPAFIALKHVNINPLFIESHRLAPFNIRGTDVAVILDLMIHDIDIVLNLVKSPVRRISASGVAVISNTADIANARIEFDNGCVANLTASRISMVAMRKTRLFQKDAYISVDFLEKKTEVYKLSDQALASHPLQIPIDIGNGQQKFISIEQPNITLNNAIKMELEEFATSILEHKPTLVSVYDGYKSMEVAHTILEKINQQIALTL